MAEVDEQTKKEVESILANPTKENVEKYPELFKKAEELGLVKKNDASGDKSDPILQEIQARYGNGYKSKEDFYAEVDNLKSGSGSIEFLKALPEPIVGAIQKFTKGENWEEAFNKGSVIDYNKDYTDNELLALKYPNKFTEAEINDPENVAVKAAKNAAKQAFLIEKQQKANDKMLAATRTEQAAKRASESLEATILDWRKKVVMLHPDYTPEKINSIEASIRSQLKTGEFYKKFVNSDGTFNIEAASNLYPINNFSEFTGAWMERGKLVAEKATHDIIDNGGKAREAQRSGGKAAPKDESKKLLENFFSTDKKPTYTLNKDSVK